MAGTMDGSGLTISMPVARSLETVFREEAAFAVRIVRRLGAPAADVEDLVQQAFVILQRRPELHTADASPRSVLFGVIRRLVADHRKKRKRATTPYDADEHGALPHQEADLERRRARRLLDEALDELDEPRREVFVLYEIEGLGMREVAELIGVPIQTAYSRLHSARATMSRALSGKDLL